MLDEYCWGPSSRAERVHRFITNVEMHRHREDFVRSRISSLQEYDVEMDNSYKVEYKEEVYRPPTITDKQV